MSPGVVFQSTVQRPCKSKGINYDFSFGVLICLRNSSEYGRLYVLFVIDRFVPVLVGTQRKGRSNNLSDRFLFNLNPGEAHSTEIHHGIPAAALSRPGRDLTQLLLPQHPCSCEVLREGQA